MGLSERRRGRSGAGSDGASASTAASQKGAADAGMNPDDGANGVRFDLNNDGVIDFAAVLSSLAPMLLFIG